jgi:type II secretory pathway component PulM
MKVVEDLQKSVDSLHANFQTFTQDIKRILARPPVNKIDPDEVAAAVKPILDGHLATVERMTARLEALEARIPKKLEYGLNESTRVLLYSMGAMLLIGLFFGYLFTPDINESANKRQAAELAGAQHQIREQQGFIDYFRKKHPRDAARYDQATDQ